MRVVYLFALTTLFILSARAQEKDDEPFDGDAFIGFSLLRYQSVQQIPSFTAIGGVASLAGNINNHIGIELEFSGYHNSNVGTYHLDMTSFNYVLGPRWSYGRTKKYDPYVHALFGGMYGASSIPRNQVLAPNTVPLSGHYAVSQSNFAMAIGGGIDIKLTNYVLLRAIQIDYFLAQLQTPTYVGTGQITPWTNATQNDLRIGFGFVFNFSDEFNRF